MHCRKVCVHWCACVGMWVHVVRVFISVTLCVSACVCTCVYLHVCSVNGVTSKQCMCVCACVSVYMCEGEACESVSVCTCAYMPSSVFVNLHIPV